MVENVAHNPTIEGSNPAGTGREKWQQSGSSTVVENVTHNPKIEGLNPAGTSQEKIAKYRLPVAYRSSTVVDY